MRDRYAGLAGWYESVAATWIVRGHPDIAELLGPGEGLCLDIGCGTGLNLEAISSTGRTPVGLDYSADQLAVARTRSRRVVQGDARRLPFSSGAFGTVTALWVSTDIERLDEVLVEVARVLRPGGIFLLYGVHPCFNGAFVERIEDGSRRVHPGYREPGRYESVRWWSPSGCGSRVGMSHVPLGPLLQSILDAPLTIRRVAECGEEPVPSVLAVVAVKPPGGAA